MSDEKEKLQPPEPPGHWRQALTGGVLGALVGLTISAIANTPWRWKGTSIGERFKILFRAMAKDATPIGTTLVGSAAGYVSGESAQKNHALTVKNIHLQREIDELKNDKSFAQTVAQEKLEKQSTPTRS